ncbi:MAG: hypothetical protein O7B26_08110 [Planctomycetota bacterium]|nr:hypothetical protein [Planctomycetota bacterium]
MNADGRFRRYLTLLALPGLTLHWLGYGAFAGTPSNAALIAARPPGTESVIVQRVSTLKGENSIVRDDYYEAVPTRLTCKNIKTAVRDATYQASVVVSAWGASDFRMPPDTGMTGNYNERAIYVVEQTLANLRKQLEAGRDIEGLDGRFDVAGVRVFRGTIDEESFDGRTMNSAGETWFVAIPDDHTVVSAESRADIVYMLKSLKEKRSAIPRRWRAIAVGHNLDSPLVILRQYPPPKKNRDPDMDMFVPPPDTGTTHFALTLPQVRSARMRISIKAKNVDKAIDWYKDEFLDESEYVWNVKRTDAGVTGTLDPKRPGEKPDSLGLRWVALFGACVMI